MNRTIISRGEMSEQSLKEYIFNVEQLKCLLEQNLRSFASNWHQSSLYVNILKNFTDFRVKSSL